MTVSLQYFFLPLQHSPLTLSWLCLRKSSSFKGATCWLWFCAWMWNIVKRWQAHRTPKRRISLDIMLSIHEESQHTPKFLRWTGLIESQLVDFFGFFSKPSLRLLWLSCDELCTEFSPSLREFRWAIWRQSQHVRAPCLRNSRKRKSLRLYQTFKLHVHNI